METTNVQKATKNIMVSFGTQVVLLVFKFIVQTLFIHKLGELYLGVNGLMTNLFTVFSFAELGLGTAISYNLYRPIADNDQPKIAAYMRFYKRAYEAIGLFVAVLGIGFMPFLHTVIKGDYVDGLYIIYRSEEHTSELQSPKDLVCR